MQISVAGKGVDIGESLRTHIEEHTQETISKYSDRINTIQAVVSKEAHQFRVDIHGNLGTHSGIVIRSNASGADVYAAFEAALNKVEKQLRRYKRRISNHHKVSMGAAEAAYEPIKGMKYILSPDFGEHDEEDEASSEQSAAVVAEKPTAIDTLSVSQAVMRMDLQELPALMFYNAGHGRLNVVYRRVDGNISWVDPAEDALTNKKAKAS